MKNQKQIRLRRSAMDLLEDPAFFSRLCRKLAEQGLVGEERSALTVFLACVTKAQAKPVSVIVKGHTSSGKSNLLSKVCDLFPEDSVHRRASLTQKAPASGEGSLSGKILYLFEYRGGKDAMYLTRIQQSEGEIMHEFTTTAGKTRSTQVAHRQGSPVILTSTTERKVFADDETRFLSLRADDSPELTRKIVQHRFVMQPVPITQPSTSVWREATRLLTESWPVFVYPSWMQLVGEQIPVGDTRARRDASRFCTLLEAVAVVRSFSDGRRLKDRGRLTLNLADYCVAYEILNEAFSSTYSGTHAQALRLAEGVRKLCKEANRSVTTHELAEELNQESQVTYKWLRVAVKDDLVLLEPGTHERNVKRYSPGRAEVTRFLPDPVDILNHGEELTDVVRFMDPLTGNRKKLRRQFKAPPGADSSAA